MIDATNLTKRYGEKTAVDNLTFTVKPGVITGFLGPNGSGKSTTMRLILGLDAPSEGTVTVAGKAYRDFRRRCMRSERCSSLAQSYTGRSAYHHLLALAQTHGIPRSRVKDLTRWSASTGSRASARASSRWGWVSGSGSRPLCWAIQRS